MKLTKESDTQLIVTHDDTSWARWCLYAALLLLALGIYSHWNDRSNRDRIYGSYCSAAMFGITYLALYERSVFVFDRTTCSVRWRRKRVWRQRGGIISFDDISSILAQTPIGDEGVPSRRITIKTGDTEIPICTAYFPDHDERCLGIADELRAFVHATDGKTLGQHEH
jgi:hypothetical protein